MSPFHLVIEGYVVSHLIASISAQFDSTIGCCIPSARVTVTLLCFLSGINGKVWYSLVQRPSYSCCIDISCKLFFKYRFLFFSPKPCPLLREDLCESLDSIYGRYMMYNHHTESLEASGRDGWTGVAFLLYSPSPPLLQGMHTISLLINCWFQTSPQNCFLRKMTPYFPIERTLSWEGAWEEVSMAWEPLLTTSVS